MSDSIPQDPVTPGLPKSPVEHTNGYFPPPREDVSVDASPTKSSADIMAENPSLSLTGNVISATFNIPYLVKYRPGADWELKSRRGQSALFDSFSYLSSDNSSWNHKVVAWTGEIETPPTLLPPLSTPPSTTLHMSSLNSLSAPVPLQGDIEAKAPSAPPTDGIRVPLADRHRLEHQLSHDKHVEILPVWLANDTDTTEDDLVLQDQARWRRYAENELYTLFHYKQHEPTDGRQERVQWADYYKMNLKFANKILEVYKPGDIVIVHDYYLMLLPRMLRQRAPHMYIAFYLHSPFPSSEFLRCLPRRKQVLEGVLGSNFIGFQSYSYSRHFSSCCTRILNYPSDLTGVDAHDTRVEVAPIAIGIDVAKAEKYAFAESVNQKYAALKKLYEGKKIIVGRDRLDSVRGVAQKLQAFETLLERYSQWHEKVVLIQVTSPTSIDDPAESATSSRVNELVLKINGIYGSLGYSPVLHYPQYLTEDEYFALLRAGDIGLITSVRDGMNTTSLEYVVCQKYSHGPLILSEFSGTAGSLTDAIHINPWDSTGVADQINNALIMDDTQRKTMQEALYRHVTTHDVRYWIDHLLNRLVQVLASRKTVVSTPLLDRALMLKHYRAAKKRLFMFDYDGTLTPIVQEPSAAVPSSHVIQVLTALASDHQNAVWIISGRDQAFLEQHLGHIPELGFSAEHGSFMRHPGETEWTDLTKTLDMSWRAEVTKIFGQYTERVPGSRIELKNVAVTWHYRQADPELGPHMAKVCQKELGSTVAKNWDVEVMPGKANLEVRPSFISKGDIAKKLVSSYNTDISNICGGNTEEDMGRPKSCIEFILCAGDDFTDEDMFRALNGVNSEDVDPDQIFSVTVGASSKVTLARWHLPEPEDLVSCIALLTGMGNAGDKD